MNFANLFTAVASCICPGCGATREFVAEVVEDGVNYALSPKDWILDGARLRKTDLETFPFREDVDNPVASYCPKHVDRAVLSD